MKWQPIRFFKHGDVESPLFTVGFAYAKKLIGLLNSLSGFQGLPPNNVIQKRIPGTGIVVQVVRTPGIDNVHITVPPIFTQRIPVVVEYETGIEPGLPLLFCGGDAMTMITVTWNPEFGRPIFEVGVAYTSAEILDILTYNGQTALVGDFGGEMAVGSSFPVPTSEGYTNVTVTAKYKCVYDRTYDVANIVESFQPEAVALSPVSGPMEASGLDYSAYDGDTGCGRTWSKTWGSLTLTAFLHETDGISDSRWSVCAAWEGDHVSINGSSSFGGFVREMQSAIDSVPDFCFMGFDADEDAGRIYVMSDDGRTLHVFDLEDDRSQFTRVGEFESGISDHSGFDADRTRLVGHSRSMAYWANFGSDKYFVEEFDFEEATSDIEQHTITGINDHGIQDALWNHVLRELYLNYEIEGEEEVFTDYRYSTPRWLCAADGYFIGCNPGINPGFGCGIDIGCTREFSNDTTESVDWDVAGGPSWVSPPIPDKTITFSGAYPGYTASYLTHNRYEVYRFDTGSIVDLGLFVCGDTSTHKGYIYHANVMRRYIYDVTPSYPDQVDLMAGSVVSYPCIPEGFQWDLNSWVFDITGQGWAGSLSKAPYVEDAVQCETLGGWTQETSGDENVAASAEGGFPWDLGWKAILYWGRDVCDNPVTAPAVAYSAGFIKVAGTENIADAQYHILDGCSGHRQFFIKHPAISITCAEGSEP